MGAGSSLADARPAVDPASGMRSADLCTWAFQHLGHNSTLTSLIAGAVSFTPGSRGEADYDLIHTVLWLCIDFDTSNYLLQTLREYWPMIALELGNHW